MIPSELEQILKEAWHGFDNRLSFHKEAVLSHASLQPYLNDLRKEAEYLKNEPLCELPFHAFRQFDTTGNRLSYETPYFHRRRCLGVFTLMAWLYGAEDYLSLTQDYLWAICNEFTWALPAHLDGNSLNEKVNPLQLDLFAAETAQTLAEILYLLRDRLDPAVSLRCRREVERRVFTPFLTRTSPYWWESCHINWAAVCGGSIGMAAIYLLQENDTEKLSLLLSQLFPVMEHFLSGFENDGACLEGLSYWTYGMSYFTAFADLLHKRSDGKLDLLAQDKVRAIASFQGKCYFAGGHTVSFSDSSCTDTFRIGITSYLARYFHYDIPVPPSASAAAFGSDPCARWCQLFRDFVWAEEAVLSSTGSFTSACVLPDAKWMIFRDNDGCGGAIKGGHNDEPHNHNDVGSFFFLLHGSEVLADLGAGEYTKDSFSDRRYTIFTNNSFSHSVPVINGSGQKNGREFAAREYYFSDGSQVLSDRPCCNTTGPAADAADPDEPVLSADTRSVCAVMDIAPAYGDKSLTSLTRHLTFDGTAHQLILSDSYTFTQPPVSLEERFVTRQKPRLQEEGSAVLYSGNGETCILSYDADLLKAAVSTDIHYRHEDGAEEIIYLLRLTLKQSAVNPVLTVTLNWS